MILNILLMVLISLCSVVAFDPDNDKAKRILFGLFAVFLLFALVS